MEIVGEVGVSNFSIAAAARRTGVSSGAPFKHFADRDALLAAAALEATAEMVTRFEAAVSSGTDAVEQLAAVAAAYVRFAGERGAAFDLIFSAGLRHAEYPDLAESRRRLPELVLPLAAAVAPDMNTAMELMEAHVALMHGYAAFLRDEFFQPRSADPTEVADRAAQAVRRLVAAYS